MFLSPQTSCGVSFSSSRIHFSEPLVQIRTISEAFDRVCEKFVVLKYRVKQVSEGSYPANFIEKIDEFINLPRGFGKSGHIVVVASPLVNLVKDQATKLANIGIPAVTLSDISEENMKVVERGAFSVVYESPEAWLKIDRWRKWSDLYS